MSTTSKILQLTRSSLVKSKELPNLRYFSSYITTTVLTKQNELFTQEQQRQTQSIGRIEKIEVRYLGLPEDVTLIMNKSLSTPFNCAQHLSEGHTKLSALAMINGNVPWDFHRPLEDSCTLQLLNFTAPDPHVVNKAFWRTCSFILGAALQNCFKDEACLRLHSFPGPNIKSGSFVYDVVLGSQSWQPSKSEMRAISAEMIKVAVSDLKIERLKVQSDVAFKMFEDIPYKREQLPSILQQNQGNVVLYRMGTHIDISRGPMVASSRFLGKCTIVEAHKLSNEGKDSAFYRIQGVALPTGFGLNHMAYGILENRAKKLNATRLPTEPYEEPQMQMV